MRLAGLLTMPDKALSGRLYHRTRLKAIQNDDVGAGEHSGV